MARTHVTRARSLTSSAQRTTGERTRSRCCARLPKGEILAVLTHDPATGRRRSGPGRLMPMWRTASPARDDAAAGASVGRRLPSAASASHAVGEEEAHPRGGRVAGQGPGRLTEASPGRSRARPSRSALNAARRLEADPDRPRWSPTPDSETPATVLGGSRPGGGSRSPRPPQGSESPGACSSVGPRGRKLRAGHVHRRRSTQAPRGTVRVLSPARCGADRNRRSWVHAACPVNKSSRVRRSGTCVRRGCHGA
jgi:hypothetical protein